MSELNNTFAAKISAENLDATIGDNPAINKELGFKSHGLVIRGAKGAVLWKQADHGVNVKDAENFIREFLEKNS